MNKVTGEDLQAFVELFESSDWDEVDIQFDDFALHLSKRFDAPSRPSIRNDAVERNAPVAAKSIPSSAVEAPPAGPPSTSVSVPEGWVGIRAPHLGTFYRAPKPGAPPLIDVGQAVGEETEVCLLEVMKLFTTLRAGKSGTVRRVCAADAQMVESGDILFLIEPHR